MSPKSRSLIECKKGRSKKFYLKEFNTKIKSKISKDLIKLLIEKGDITKIFQSITNRYIIPNSQGNIWGLNLFKFNKKAPTFDDSYVAAIQNNIITVNPDNTEMSPIIKGLSNHKSLGCQNNTESLFAVKNLSDKSIADILGLTKEPCIKEKETEHIFLCSNTSILNSYNPNKTYNKTIILRNIYDSDESKSEVNLDPLPSDSLKNVSDFIKKIILVDNKINLEKPLAFLLDQNKKYPPISIISPLVLPNNVGSIYLTSDCRTLIIADTEKNIWECSRSTKPICGYKYEKKNYNPIKIPRIYCDLFKKFKCIDDFLPYMKHVSQISMSYDKKFIAIDYSKNTIGIYDKEKKDFFLIPEKLCNQFRETVFNKEKDWSYSVDPETSFFTCTNVQYIDDLTSKPPYYNK